MKQYDALIEQYISLCKTRNISEGSISTRRREIEKFGIWVKRKRPRPKIEDINTEQILEYLKDRSAFKARTTVQSCYSDLRCFFEFLVTQNVWRKNPLRWIQGPKLTLNSHIPKCPNQSSIEKIFENCFRQKGKIFQYQMPAIFLILYTLGIRRGEVLSLNLRDWDRETKTIKIVSTKSSRERYMPVPASLERALEAYLPVRHNLLIQKQRENETALFLTQYGERISGTVLSKHLKDISKKSGVLNFTIHQLRHTCATNLLSKGASLPQVRMVLGHVSIETTMRYTHISSPDRWDAMKKHPLNDFLASKEEHLCQTI